MTHRTFQVVRWSSAWLVALISFVASIQVVLAGPPYQSDDPQPTDYKHFEIYTFNKGSLVGGGNSSVSGIDFNYGAAPNPQLTAVLPVEFDNLSDAAVASGISNIELAAKYHFLRQDSFGLDVSIFPRIFLPSASGGCDPRASLLLPIWVQKDWSDISAFGGGGCQVSLDGRSNSFCLYGAISPTPQGTASFVNEVRLAKQNGLKVLLIVSPSYADYDGGPACQVMSLSVDSHAGEHAHLRRPLISANSAIQ